MPSGFPPVSRCAAAGRCGGTAMSPQTAPTMCSASSALSGGSASSSAREEGVASGTQSQRRATSGSARRTAPGSSARPSPRRAATNATRSATPSVWSRSTAATSPGPGAACALSSSTSGRPSRCMRGSTPAYASVRSASSARTRYRSACSRELPPSRKCWESRISPRWALPPAFGYVRYHTDAFWCRRCVNPSATASRVASMAPDTSGPVPVAAATTLAATFPAQRPAREPIQEPLSFSSRIRSTSRRIRSESASPQPPAATATSPDISRGKVIRPAPVTGAASCSASTSSACPSGDQEAAGRSGGGARNCSSAQSTSATGVCPR